MIMLQKTDILVARSVGILCIASGFVFGMQGLDEPNSFWMPTSLGLILTGLIAQIYALIRSTTYATKIKKQENHHIGIDHEE